jgi:pimeloyl-ACP methyl ester carboxylesterase
MVTFVLSLALAVPCAAADLPSPVAETFNCSLEGSRWPYLVQLPEGEPEAILVYLHGHYGNEQQGMGVGAYNNAFGRLREECLRRQWAYVSTYYGGNTWMGPVGESGVADLIGLLRARWPGRPLYLCGGSMGGSSTLVFAVRRPELLDGAIALCPAADIQAYYHHLEPFTGGVEQSLAAAIRIHYRADGADLETELAARSALGNAERLTMPVYLSHGAADGLIPVDYTRALAARLQELERPVRYVEIPEGDHDAPVVQVNWPEALDFVAGVAPQ